MSIRIAVMTTLLICVGSVYADAVDDLVEAEMKQQHIPGLSIAVVQDGKIVKKRGYGFSNVEQQVAVTPQTVFQSGSLGKQFTAALVMLLVEDGKIGLDDPISKHLLDTPDTWRKITVRHLLTHTSGLADPYKKLDLRKDYTDDELLKIEESIPLRFQPGEKWAYSNMGYHVLGFLCSRVGKKFYGDQLRERLFEPIGMNTRIISERNIVPHRASGYDWVNGELKNQAWVSPSLNTTADGSLYLTAHDLALWDLALYGERPLSHAIKLVSWTPVKLNDNSTVAYGFGWSLVPYNGHSTIEHSGAWQGFSTQISRFIDDKLTVIVLTNLSRIKTGKIAHEVADLYLPTLTPQAAIPLTNEGPR
jgi:CubicO group peptidase (beta-lactamase class C family)